VAGGAPDLAIRASDGNVGINAANPASKLTIGGDAAASRFLVGGIQGAYKTGRSISTNGSFLTSDCILGINDTTAPRSVEISSAAISQGSATNFREIIVKDESGGAGSNNITITTEGAQNIDGVGSISITVDYGSLKLYSSGNNLFTL
jgi:hypothetical protein